MYHNVLPITREEAEIAFTYNDPSSICDALLRVTYHDPDLFWIQDKCIEFVTFPDKIVQGLAVTCLGHLARIHGKLDTSKVIPILNGLRSDPEIGGRVEDALDDIEMFLS
jgi:hypothetical protein